MPLSDFLTDGLPSDYEGTITQASFLYDPRYNNGQTLLAALTVTTTEGSEVELRYPLGPGWTAVGGQRIAHESGNNKINKQTAYGEFCARVGALLPDDVADQLNPLEASAWIGLSFFFQRETQHKSFTDREGNNVSREVTRTWPTKFLGSSTSGPVTVAAAPPLPDDVVTISGGHSSVQIPTTLAQQVRTLAGALDYADWAAKVLALEGALDHEDLIRAVSDAAFYQALK